MYNTPFVELNRSPAAQTVAKLASDSGLFLTHFEHRHHFATPSMWLPEDRLDLGGDISWNNGVLKEHKYLHFRYDQPLGSFHPGHRAKWTTHELCHGLVGFTWRPDMTPLSHSLAARLSELLPVALWYFFDEVQLRRCPLHFLQGALFQDHCVYCEQLATQGPRLPEVEDERFLKDGLRFVKDELAMISKSKRFGRPLPNRYATLDLNSDAMAYVAQNIRRMEDPTFRMFIELFHGHHTGMWADLDELEGRVWGLTEALSGGLPANPLPAGKDHWIAQDIGWRLLMISAQCEDKEAVDRLESLAEGLAKNPQNLTPVFTEYHDLFDTFFIPEPEMVFGLGYPLVNEQSGMIWGSDLTQLYHGVDSACPSIAKALGAEGLSEQISGFAVWDLDQPQRLGIGKRFAEYLSKTAHGPLSDLALYEACLQHPEPPDPWSAAFGWHSMEGSLIRRAQGVDVLSLGVEVNTLIEAIERDDEEIDVPEREHWMLIVNQAGGIRRIAEISKKAADSLYLLSEGPMERHLVDLDEEDWETLLDAGAITPCNWHIYTPEKKEAPSILLEGPLPDAFALTSSRGMWRQAQTQRDRDELLEQDALEPAPLYEVESEKGFTGPPQQIDAENFNEHHNTQEAVVRSLSELASMIDEVRSGVSYSVKSGLRAKHSDNARKRWDVGSFKSAPHITSAEALQEMGYNEARPAENAFEEQLRQALAAQRVNTSSQKNGLSVNAHSPVESYEDLFTFDLEDSIDELQEDEIDQELKKLELAGSQKHLNQTDSQDDDLGGKDVGFGERWGDWDKKS